ncbi:heterogeneous nuclear ribonucleoprotein-like [Haematococcus lacustris]|uniref:Heterogeneous nuclear ribonucleoprotein-like n=1 Tax=Haematococcus lacustris TaxID=44745 RepID=A0A699YYU3_HAELA|nr:heterogeneous nuclear ribonucleoprotein-like [Haematococcus lacustris]
MQEPEPGSADLPGSAPAAGEADVAATDQAPSMLPSSTKQTLHNYFGRFGAIDDAVVMRDRIFVTFEEEGALERVFEAGVMHVLSGKQVEVKPATPKGQQPLPSSMGMQAGLGGQGQGQ